MRDIKFRAWTGKEMLKVSDFDCARTPPYFFYSLVNIDKDGIPTQGYCINRDDTDFELMQYTGLKDIYESDLVKVPEHYEGDCLIKAYVGEVVFEDGEFFIKGKLGQYCSLFDFVKNYKGEVIGNIYENPELICHN